MITNDLLPKKETTTIGKPKYPFKEAYFKDLNILRNLSINDNANFTLNAENLKIKQNAEDTSPTNMNTFINNLVNNTFLNNKNALNINLLSLIGNINFGLPTYENLKFINIIPDGTINVALPAIKQGEEEIDFVYELPEGFMFIIIGKDLRFSSQIDPNFDGWYDFINGFSADTQNINSPQYIEILGNNLTICLVAKYQYSPNTEYIKQYNIFSIPLTPTS